GGGLLAWSAAGDAPWLTVTPASGVGATTLTVAASVAGLAPGTYTTTVTVTASGVQGSPQAVAVTLTVAAPPPPPPPPPPSTVLLVGDQQIAASTDYNPAGTAEAYRAVAGASG